MKTRLRLAILTMGISGLVAQMLLLRELLIVFSGNELSIGIILANWLLLEASGSFFLAKKAENTKNKVETFAGITILFSLSLPAAVYFTRLLKVIIGVSIGESIGFLPILYSSFLILLPVSATHGALFTFFCKIYSIFIDDNASSIGKVYYYETVGTIFGGIVWTYLLIPYLNAFQMALGLAMLNFLVLLFLFSPFWNCGKFQKNISVIAGVLLIFSSYLLLSGKADFLHHISLNAQWKNQNLIHNQNSIYGNTSVVKSGDQYLFFSDGILSLITPIPDIEFVEKFVHLPLLFHPNPKRMLILSGGAGGVIDETLKHQSIEMLEYAELDPLFLKLIRRFPTSLTETELTHRKVTVKHIDGRLFLRRTPTKYDLILVGLLNPSDLQTNRFFTKEFFALAKMKLNKDGILVMGLPGSLSYINEELKNLNACIYNTLKSIFPYVRVFPGDGTNLFLSSGSDEIILIDRKRLINRLTERDIKVNVLVPRHINIKLHPGWKNWFLEFIEGSTQEINRDFRPLGMFYSVSHWNALFAPYLSWLFRWFKNIDLPMICISFIFFIIIFYLSRLNNLKWFGSGIPLCIATTGFAGMIFDLSLIFIFQSIYGYVFYWIGILVTSFMAGAAFGALIITSLLPKIKNYLNFFIYIDLTIICFSFALPFIFMGLHPYLGSPIIFFLLKILFLLIGFACGFLIGAQFPLANNIYLKDCPNLSKTAGVLYSSDLLGGWLGGVAGGVVLLPVLGLLGSCVVVGLLKFSSFIILTAHARATV